jgi:ABC-type Na+ transport system ATPase subunit NatA
MSTAISVNDLSKVYGGRSALSHATFEVPLGTVCGFVGPNGSGKTTTIRMLLGLITPSGGTGTVLGESITHPERYLPKVGAMIEGPAFYPALSGAENLRVLFAGRTKDLLAAQVATLVAKPEFSVDLNKLVEIATRHGHSARVAEGEVFIVAEADWGATFNRLAFNAGITLSILNSTQPSLEETFFEMTGE